MQQFSEIIKFLSNNKTDNINLINFMENYPLHYIKKTGDSVLVKGTSDRDWIYISSNSSGELKQITAELNLNDKCFAAVEDWMLPVLSEGKKLKWILSSLKLILPDGKIIQQPKHAMSELTLEDTEFIYTNSNYKDFISIPYITDRLTKGEHSCIRFQDKPAAWGITQDDGAIGFLHVLPEFRRMGLGKDITLDLIRKVREKNKIPFVHIEEKNIKSMGLVMGLGFKKVKAINWFEFK